MTLHDTGLEEVVFRKATAADLPALAALRAAFTFEEPGESRVPRGDFVEAFDETVGAGIASGRWTVWIAEAHSEIVAHIYVGLLEKTPRPVDGHRWIGCAGFVSGRDPLVWDRGAKR